MWHWGHKNVWRTLHFLLRKVICLICFELCINSLLQHADVLYAGKVCELGVKVFFLKKKRKCQDLQYIRQFIVSKTVWYFLRFQIFFFSKTWWILICMYKWMLFRQMIIRTSTPNPTHVYLKDCWWQNQLKTMIVLLLTPNLTLSPESQELRAQVEIWHSPCHVTYI